MSEKKPTFDRSKLKASSVAKMEESEQHVTAVVGGGGDRLQADYLKITPGTNMFRLFPFHPEGEGDAYLEARVIHWLPMLVQEKDKNGNLMNDAKGKPIMKEVTRPIFNSKIHAGTPKDIIEEYISKCEKVAKDIYPGDNSEAEEKRKKFLEPVFGVYQKKIQGLLAQPAWVAYALKMIPNGAPVNGKQEYTRQFGKLEVRKAIKMRLNQLAANESGSEPLGTDPFTDVEKGRCIIVTYNDKATKPQDYYQTEIDSSFDKVTDKISLYPFTDEELEKWIQYPSLSSMFKNSYKKKDFDQAVKSLKYFDDKHELGVFAYEDFLATIKEIKAYYPDTDNKDLKEAMAEENEDMFATMNREELKQFIRDNEVPIVVNQAMKDDKIREECKKWYLENKPATTTTEPPAPTDKVESTSHTPLPEKEEGEEEDEHEGGGDVMPWDKKNGEEPKEVKTSAAAKTSQDRVKAIRDKAKKK